MGRTGCTYNGDLNDSMFGKPMLWIGIYVAVASLACLFAMGADALRGFRHRKLWFPCKYFSLNSSSLTIISIALKFPMDLTSHMPHRQDQLAKLSSTILICTAMANFTPSLGTMESKETSMNMMALSILVITLITNVSVQMGTGAIYIFLPEHALIMFSMLVLLVILVFSALTIPTTKHLLEQQYRLKLQQAKDEALAYDGESPVKKLREHVKKSWMMAHTCCPQFVMGRWVTCTASGAFCLLSSLILMEAILRSCSGSFVGSLKFCGGKSEYNWSTTLVLVVQSTAVWVGTIAPVFRWLNAVKHFRCLERGEEHSCKNEFKVERCWTKRLEKWKESPIAFCVHGQQCRKLVHTTKNLLLDFCIGMQTTVVVVSKAVMFSSIFFVRQIRKVSYGCRFCLCCCKRLHKGNGNALNNESGSDSGPTMKLDLSHFVIHLQGEEKLVELIAKNGCEATDNWIQRGRMMRPTYLIQLLNDKSTMSNGLKGVRNFDSDQVPTLCSEEAPHGWALTVVTLLSIAMSLSNIDNHLMKMLLCGVREGLRYVRLIEKKLDKKGEFTNIRKAADIVWLRIELYNKWFNEDLEKLALEGKSPISIVKKLADTGKNYVMDFMNSSSRSRCELKENPLEWPAKVVAANSMYRLGQTILQVHDDDHDQTIDDALFEGLSQTISQVLAACLTNLPQVISIMCFCKDIKKGEKSIHNAAYLLGETEFFLKTLGKQEVSNMDRDQLACIDNLCSLSLSRQDPSPLPLTVFW